MPIKLGNNDLAVTKINGSDAKLYIGASLVKGGGSVTPTLGTLSLSGSLVNGTASSGTISGATASSIITSLLTGLTVNSAARTYAFDGTSAVGTSGGLVETLAGAIGSPKTNPVIVQSSSSSFVLSNKSGSLVLTNKVGDLTLTRKAA